MIRVACANTAHIDGEGPLPLHFRAVMRRNACGLFGGVGFGMPEPLVAARIGDSPQYSLGIGPYASFEDI